MQASLMSLLANLQGNSTRPDDFNPFAAERQMTFTDIEDLKMAWMAACEMHKRKN
jgi:hypothetical protein